MSRTPQSEIPNPRLPGAVLLEELMEPLGLTAYRVAKEISVAPITISEILRGLRAISPVMACRLGAYFNVSPEYWLSMQASYDAQLALSRGAANGVKVCSALKNDVSRLPGRRGKTA